MPYHSGRPEKDSIKRSSRGIPAVPSYARGYYFYY
jgi:hypothetical protein